MLSADDRKRLAPELIALCRTSFAGAGKIGNRDRRTMHDYCNLELRGKVMPDEVIEALLSFALWQAGNDRFARSA
jgi:hypothetical protein